PGGAGQWVALLPTGANHDCNDADPSISPSATEIIGNTVDENCDGLVQCFVDVDGDGFIGTNIDTCGAPGTSYGTPPGGDCCDNSNQTFPGQGACFTTANACGSFDYNCDGGAVSCYAGGTATCDSDPDTGECIGGGGAWVGGMPACGSSGMMHHCI